MYFQKFPWLATLISKIITNFKIFDMMYVRCVMKFASIFKYIYIYIYSHIDKLVKLI